MKKDSLNITVDGYRISSVTYGDNGVKSITIDGGDENRNYSYEVTLTDEGMTVKQSVLPKWHGEPIIVEESDEPKVGDMCIFWCDWSNHIVVGRLDELLNVVTDKQDCIKCLYRIGDFAFQNCVKYSDEKLIEIANKICRK